MASNTLRITPLIDLLNQRGANFCYSIVNQLADKENLTINGSYYPRDYIVAQLRGWAQANFTDIAFPAAENLFLDTLSNQVFTVVKTATKQGNLPSPSQIKDWQNDLREFQAWQDAITDVADASRFQELEKIGIKEEIRMVEKEQQTVGRIVEPMLGEYLTPEEKTVVNNYVSQAFFRQLVNGDGKIDEDFVWETVENLCEQNLVVGVALERKKRNQLVSDLHGHVQNLGQDNLDRLQKAHEATVEAAIVLAPSRKQLKQKISQETGVNDWEAGIIVANLERNLPPHPCPTEAETKDSIDRSLTSAAIKQIRANGRSVQGVIDNLSFGVKGYYLAAPLAQQSQSLSRPVSKEAIYWAREINKRRSAANQISPTEVENLLRGIDRDFIDEEIRRLGGDAGGARVAKLKNLHQEIEAVDNDRLVPRRFRFKIAGARAKAKAKRFFDRTNPFGLTFYHTHLPGPTRFLESKLAALNFQINYFRNFPGRLRARFLAWRWQQWTKFCQRISNRRLRRFLLHFPSKMHFSNLARPGYWLQRGTGRFLLWTGQKLGQRALGGAFRFVGGQLLKQGAGALIKKLTAYGLGALLGIGTGGVATVITAGLAVVNLFGKQLLKLAKNLAASLAILIIKFPFTFALTTLGFAIGGPVGMVIGSSVGFLLDKMMGFFGGLGNTLGAAGQVASTSLALPANTVAAAGTSAAFSTSLSLWFAGVSGSLFVAAAAVITAISSSFSNFGPPQGFNPSESESIKISKKASKNSFNNSDLAAGQTITYTIQISPKNGKIEDVQLSDEFTITSKTTPAPPEPEKNPILTPPREIDKDLNYSYKITIDNRYQDASLKNTITLSGKINGKTETVTASAIVNIGSPPKPSTVQLAENIVNLLLNCTGLEKSATSGVIVSRSSWPTAKQCLVNGSIDQSVIQTLEGNFSGFNFLQCVYFAVAASQGTLPGKPAARDYCQSANLIVDWSNLSAGDYVVSSLGYAGHIAVVSGRDNDIITLAEAMGDTGSVQFRKLGLAVLKERYCGFIKGT